MYHRLIKILDMLQKYQHLDLRETAIRLGVSEMTIRRDFRILEAEKKLLQVKKGATLYPSQFEPDALLSGLNDIKFKLANVLYERIFPCETLFIGTGTTCLAFAKTIARRNNLPNIVITHSLSVAAALFQSKSHVILLGGELRTSSMDLVGPVAEKNIREYQVDWLVSGCDGASAENGFYTSDIQLSNLEKQTISIAHHVAVITESKKFSRRSLVSFASQEKVNLLVTDKLLPKSDQKKLQSSGMEIVLTSV